MTEAPALYLNGSAFIGQTAVFTGADLRVSPGQWTCLLGSSGVGKSTVLKLFAGLADQVAFDGSFGAEGMALDGQVALMAQDDLLLPWLTALDNVMIGARLRGTAADRSRALDVLARVGLADKADQKPRALSGGQRQRVALARTLLEDRPIVLLDEPFSALDVRTRTQMQDLAAELLAGRTVLLVTHDPAEAVRLGHEILLMEFDHCQTISPPTSDMPRDVTDPEVMRVQADLMARLCADELEQSD
jgi:putative hydroxymethylpyrimidine transport system ATP-binding protein